MVRLLPLGLVLLSLACATAPAIHSDVRGPSTVFATIDAAAFDALGHADQLANTVGGVQRMQAGTIRKVAGGYTYDAPQVASAASPNRIDLAMSPDTVAHFRNAPRVRDWRANRRNERFTRKDRRIVDRLDPLGRPVYLLTPSRAVLVYRGRDEGSQRVAHLGGPAPELRIASRTDY
jgi:hypothetical protein